MAKQKSTFRQIIDIITGNSFPSSGGIKGGEPQASTFTGGTVRNAFSVSYNGEKNLGEIGPIIDYSLDYEALRLRSWQSYLESEISKTVLDKFTLWMISKGLKLQSNPMAVVLKSEGIEIEAEKFNEVTESRFAIWARSTMSAYSGISNLDEIAKEAFRNSKIGGDVLVILRYENNTVKVQLVDGSHVCSPGYGNDHFAQAMANGNEIRNGIELSPKGDHVAYYIRKKDYSYVRVEAKSATSGMQTAFLIYGSKHRLDNHRGVPLIATCLETAKKLERYKEAAVGSAEERQKIVLSIEHNDKSTGENPFLKGMAKGFNSEANDDLPKDINGIELANTVAATTDKSTFNMPIGSSLKAIESKQEMFFKEFYQTNSEIICSAIGIPPNVAFSIYNDSFSASRAATKDWEHTIIVNRENFTAQFYQKIYNFWLYTEILKNKITAPGYLEAFSKKNDMAIEAYQNARFTGSLFPHIDPLKEVNAERLKLGSLADSIPLTTVEAATEALNSGDSDSNIEQFQEEYEDAKERGLISPKNEQPINSPI